MSPRPFSSGSKPPPPAQHLPQLLIPIHPLPPGPPDLHLRPLVRRLRSRALSTIQDAATPWCASGLPTRAQPWQPAYKYESPIPILAAKILKSTDPNPHHRRQNTDPFVDQARTSAEIPRPTYNQPSPTSTPRLLSPGIGYGIGSRQTEPIYTSLFADPGPYYAQNAVPSQRLTTTALTEQQKRALRQTWIEEGAREIAALARARAAADAQYQHSRSPADLQLLREATAALAEATSLERRVEQRRNLFMPVGMQAMRTTAESQPQDGFGGEEMRGGRGEGRLFGGQMAVMERICGEVMRSAEERRRKRGGA
jgi:hypothetical protein